MHPPWYTEECGLYVRGSSEENFIPFYLTCKGTRTASINSRQSNVILKLFSSVAYAQKL